MEIVFPASVRESRDMRQRIVVRVSPLHEATIALHALSRPSQHGALLTWALASRQELSNSGLRILQDLMPLLTGPLRSIDPRTVPPLAGGFREEIEWARHQPDDDFVRDVRHLRLRWTELYDPKLGRHSEWSRMSSLHSQRLWADLEARAPSLKTRLMDLLERFWERSFAPAWADIGPMLEDEARVLRRSLAAKAPCDWLAHLSPRIHCDADEASLRCHVPWGEESHLHPDYEIISSPSVFVWPHLFVTSDAQSILLTFQSQAISAFASPVHCADQTRRALQALGDGSRLEVFRHLVGRPVTTNALAHTLRITPSTVARHLQQLQAAGLIHRRQQGHYAFYEADAEALLMIGSEIAEMRRVVHPALERWLMRETVQAGAHRAPREQGALARRMDGPGSVC